MCRHRYICIAALTMILAISLAACWPREPSYEGYPLSCWLQIGYGTGMTHGETDREDADAAIKHIGTNALPYLVKELGATYSHVRWKLFHLLRNQSIIPVSYRYPDERRRRAIEGFVALGRVGTPALPQISQHLADPELRGDAQQAINAILEGDPMSAFVCGGPLSAEQIVEMERATEYGWTRLWVERHCPTSAVPASERIFVIQETRPRKASIVPHQLGFTLGEVLRHAGIAARGVRVVRKTGPASDMKFETDDSDFEVLPLDLISIQRSIK